MTVRRAEPPRGGVRRQAGTTGRSGLWVAGLLVAGLLLVSGCGVVGIGSDDETSAPPSSSSSSSGSTGPSDTGTGSGTGGSGGTGTAVEGLDDPIATATVPGPDGLEIALVEATVVGDLLRVRLAYTPTTVPAGDERYNVYQLNQQNDPGPYLVDATNLLRYEVVLAEGVALRDDVVFTNASGGAPVVTTQYYAAPQDPTAPLELAWGAAPWPTFEFTPGS